MKDIPIIFSAPMVLALLAGRKTMTRRLAYRNGKPSSWHGVPADGARLWVREAMKFDTTLRFAADMKPVDTSRAPHGYQITRPAISGMFMPRWASRLTLVVTATKIERLQDISEADAKAEGVDREFRHSWGVGHNFVIPVSHRGGFCNIWCGLYGADSWIANPEVVALSFRVEKINIDLCGTNPGGLQREASRKRGGRP